MSTRVSVLLLLIAIVLLGVLISACDKRGIYQGQMGSVESKARERVRTQWEKRFTLCGDTYYGMSQSEDAIFALQALPETWKVRPLSLTPADQANQIVWHGTVTVEPSISSVYDLKNRSWSAWKNGTGAFWSILELQLPFVFHVVLYENEGYEVSTITSSADYDPYRENIMVWLNIERIVTKVLGEMQRFTRCENIPARHD